MAFLTNYAKQNVTVQIQNIPLELLPKSISILPDCKNITFNSAKVIYNLQCNNVFCSFIHVCNPGF